MSAILAHSGQNPALEAPARSGVRRVPVIAPGTRRWQLVSKVLLLTGTGESAADILPSLSLLDHAVTVAAGRRPARWPGGQRWRRPTRCWSTPDTTWSGPRNCSASSPAPGIPLLAVISEGAWAAITAEWGVDDVMLHTAGPGEVEARIRLAVGRAAPAGPADPRSRRGPVGRAGHRRGDLLGADPRRHARPDLQGVRAAEVPRPAPEAGVHQVAAARRGLGLRLLRRHQDRRRARAQAPGQARVGQRGADRHGAQRGVQVRSS